MRSAGPSNRLLPYGQSLPSSAPDSAGQSFTGDAASRWALHAALQPPAQKRDGPLFRGRYKAIVVDDEGYKWSSCRVYLEPRRRPKWLDTEQLLSRFPKEGCRAAFLGFMRSKIEEPVKSFYEGRRWLPVLGSKKFIDVIRGRVRKMQRDLREVPEAKLYIRPDFKTCLEVVGRVYGSGKDELMRSRRGQRNEARVMAMYLCRRVAGMKHEEIAKEDAIVFVQCPRAVASSGVTNRLARLGMRCRRYNRGT